MSENEKEREREVGGWRLGDWLVSVVLLYSIALVVLRQEGEGESVTKVDLLQLTFCHGSPP